MNRISCKANSRQLDHFRNLGFLAHCSEETHRHRGEGSGFISISPEGERTVPSLHHLSHTLLCTEVEQCTCMDLAVNLNYQTQESHSQGTPADATYYPHAPN